MARAASGPSSSSSEATARRGGWFAHDPVLVRARRRVVAIEYRLGCKLGALGAIQRMERALEPPPKEDISVERGYAVGTGCG